MEAGDVALAASFECGGAVLDEWLRRYAWQNHNSGGARVFVAIDRAADRIAAFYCLSAAEIGYAEAPARISKGMARHPIPAVLIGRLAVDRRYHGQNLGRFIVRDALLRIVETADVVGVRAIAVQAKDDRAAEFYRGLGFEKSASAPRMFFMLVKDAKKSLAAASRPDN